MIIDYLISAAAHAAMIAVIFVALFLTAVNVAIIARVGIAIIPQEMMAVLMATKNFYHYMA